MTEVVSSPPSSGLVALTLWSFLYTLLVFCPVVTSHDPHLPSFPSEGSSLTIPISLALGRAIPIGTSLSLTTITTTTIAATSTSTAQNQQADSSVPDLSSRANTSNVGAVSLAAEQMIGKAKGTIIILSSLIAYVSINSLVRALNPAAFIWYDEDRDEQRWIASSRSWFDRKACRWLSLCGTAHFRPVGPRFGQRRFLTESNTSASAQDEAAPWWAFWFREQEHPANQWDDAERSLREIPDYVFEYAPLVHLFSNEQFWPCDIAEHLFHITPMLNYTPVQSQRIHPTLENLDQLNQWQDGRYVFLTSNDDAEERPPWMEGEKNIPVSPDEHSEESWSDWDGRVDGAIPGDTPDGRLKWYDTNHKSMSEDEAANLPLEDLGYSKPEDLLQDESVRDELRKRYGGEPIKLQETGGRSDAPAVLLVVDKGNGIVDAFWFFFYSFNLGNVVLNVRFGNHIGDWEHCLVRFYNGKPKALFFSAHSAGEAYSYEAVEKIGQRPVIYSAVGTHAMYATPGVHSYVLPWGLLHDQTDRGPLWDPLLNSHMYTYDYANDTLRASTASPLAPTEWFYFNGHWGDKFYPLGDRRQYRFAGQYHYVNGPLGPRFKHLDRRKVCQGPDEDPCVIRDWVGEKMRPKRLSNPQPHENPV
ncbi:vacuolar protein sorting-associated protein 62 [Aspergillus viridinutans]|uniref:Vacuolar protein sorting-associated protein 62 n=1 Tax=Aspergillus viridinutans TaxID=75553 RepID=A0A9P3BMM1_ASPVI|nr:vacuolar protein sorting-associated protein 62 [Aspergillus viridinutans]GIJ98979.1 vacuolar protein sorting-associated protein 62 [Aspergillus viridinutans]